MKNKPIRAIKFITIPGMDYVVYHKSIKNCIFYVANGKSIIFDIASMSPLYKPLYLKDFYFKNAETNRRISREKIPLTILYYDQAKDNQ